MAAESGINGSVVLGANSVLNISEWSIDIKNNIQDSTAFGDTWEQKLPGLKGATGNLKGLLNVGDTTGQALLKTAVLAGTTVALILYNNANHYDFTAFIDGLKTDNKVDGVCEVEFSFVADGAVTLT